MANYYLSLSKYNSSAVPVGQFKANGRWQEVFLLDNSADTALKTKYNSSPPRGGDDDYSDSADEFEAPPKEENQHARSFRVGKKNLGKVLADCEHSSDEEARQNWTAERRFYAGGKPIKMKPKQKKPPTPSGSDGSGSDSEPDDDRGKIVSNGIDKSKSVELKSLDNEFTPTPMFLDGHRHFCHFYIAGQTGSGKSTLANTIVREMIRVRPELKKRIFIITRAKDPDPAFDGTDVTFIDMDDECWAPFDKEKIAKEYEKELKKYDMAMKRYETALTRYEKDQERLAKEAEADNKKKETALKKGKTYEPPKRLRKPIMMPEEPEEPEEPDFDDEPEDLLKEFEHSIMIFDDFESHPSKKVSENFSRILADLLENGRKSDIVAVHIAHKLLDYRTSRNKILESPYVCFFPQTNKNMCIQYMETYATLNSKQIATIMKLNSRWICFYNKHPQIVLHQHGCFIVE